jgi:ubiquinone/menaquinone biosynthesis C-methylase UbiE
MNKANDFSKKKVNTKLPSWIFRALYWYIDKLDKHRQVIFMNYGYSDPGEIIMLSSEDEINRYPVQLYHHLCEMADLNGKDIVEVGCGRGGGLAYIARTYSPSTMTGIDLEKSSVAFSNKYHNYKNLSFIKGNAGNLPMKDNSCDILLNVESSHRYISMVSFVSEVVRVLRPGGCFLFADFRYDHEWPSLFELLRKSGLKILLEKDITSNILRSLELDSERRVSLVKTYAPGILKKGILNFAGSVGTETYSYFQTRVFTYKSIMLQKEAI